MSKKAFEKIAAGLRDAIAHARGERTGKVHTIQVSNGKAKKLTRPT
jgi:hypothetical protein